MSIAAAYLRLENPEAAFPLLDNIAREDVGLINYLFVLNLTALSQYELGLVPEARATASSAFEIVEDLRAQGINQSWLYEMEATLNAVVGNQEEAVAAFEEAFNLGARNLYGFSIFWVLDRLLDDDQRYLELRRLIDEDVERMQREINAEIETCKQSPDDCMLAPIDDV